VLPQPAARNGKPKAGFVVGWTGGVIEQERSIDFLDGNSAVLHGLDYVGNFERRRSAFSGSAYGRVSAYFTYRSPFAICWR
jgi:hypothetical protein